MNDVCRHARRLRDRRTPRPERRKGRLVIGRGQFPQRPVVRSTAVVKASPHVRHVAIFFSLGLPAGRPRPPAVADRARARQEPVEEREGRRDERLPATRACAQVRCRSRRARVTPT